MSEKRGTTKTATPETTPKELLKGLIAERIKQVEDARDTMIHSNPFEQIESIDIRMHLKPADQQAMSAINGKIVRLAEQTVRKLNQIGREL